MKKSFTLVELLAVIILLGIVALLLAPVTIGIINRSKQKMYDHQEKEILAAARIYVSDNSTSNVELNTVGIPHEITLKQLYDLGYINLPIKNYLTNLNFNENCYLITITKEVNTFYDYEIDINGNC